MPFSFDDERRRQAQRQAEEQAEAARKAEQRLREQYMETERRRIEERSQLLQEQAKKIYTASPFPGVIRELEDHLRRNGWSSTDLVSRADSWDKWWKKIVNPKSEYFGSWPQTFKASRGTRSGMISISIYKDFDIIALPTGVIKITGFLGLKSVQANELNVSLVEKLVEGAWNHAHTTRSTYHETLGGH